MYLFDIWRTQRRGVLQRIRNLRLLRDAGIDLEDWNF